MSIATDNCVSAMYAFGACPCHTCLSDYVLQKQRAVYDGIFLFIFRYSEIIITLRFRNGVTIFHLTHSPILTSMSQSGRVVLA
jgi:hypothetical protein